MKRFTLLFLTLLASFYVSSQTPIYETGVGSGDPWTGWTADSSNNCILSSIDSTYYWDFLFDTQNNSNFTSSLAKVLDLTMYSSTKFVYKLNWAADYLDYQIAVSADSINWTYIVNESGVTTAPVTDSVIVSQPVNFIVISTHGEVLSPMFPFGGTTYHYLRIFDASTNGLEPITNNEKELVRITDMSGRETADKPNTLLIYMYSDGTKEKVFKMMP